MDKHSPEKKKTYLKLIAVSAALLALIGLLTVLCMPFFRKLTNPAYQQQLQAWVDSLGFGGWLMILGVQILQIIIAFIPGEPVELLAGVLYGAWGGLLTCLAGIVIAQAAVFFFVRKIGSRFVERLFGKNTIDQFRFLNTTEKVETATFLLFLIPGTPKDTLTYIAGLTPIKPSQFLLLSTFARIPSVITSTWMGATVSRGEWVASVLIFLLTAAIGLVGIFYKDKLMAHLHRLAKGNKG